ncbi:unnamed protein product [Fusarium venenatum]|uniref:Uncharacterized protein n=1 Tax=Fusarium venenatum TaxID=56646 RepID=A0A2L2T759_9HYPO|nr:uncharacterized protein FVRRES_03206 [Fusarium venenatum]CEI66694.1 unnamed protein product [Fusarium venenatum]
MTEERGISEANQRNERKSAGETLLVTFHRIFVIVRPGPCWTGLGFFIFAQLTFSVRSRHHHRTSGYDRSRENIPFLSFLDVLFPFKVEHRSFSTFDYFWSSCIPLSPSFNWDRIPHHLTPCNISCENHPLALALTSP